MTRSAPRTCGPGSLCSPSSRTTGPHWCASCGRRRARLPLRRSRRRDGVPALADARRHLAASMPRTAGGLRDQGGAGGQDAHRRGPSPTRSTRRRWPASHRRALVDPQRLRGHSRRGSPRQPPPRSAPRPSGRSSLQLDPAGDPRRLPGHRARRPLARRPRQPAAGRLRRPGRRLARLDDGADPGDLADEKLLVTSRRAAAAARRCRSGSSGRPPGPPLPNRLRHALRRRAAATRRATTCVAVVTRPRARSTGSADGPTTRSRCPPATWTDVLTGRARESDGGGRRSARMLDRAAASALLVTRRDD